jgi:hypothetical protein
MPLSLVVLYTNMRSISLQVRCIYSLLSGKAVRGTAGGEHLLHGYAPISLANGIGLLGLLGNPNNTRLYAAYSLASTNQPPPEGGARTGPGDPSAEITEKVFWVRSGMGL